MRENDLEVAIGWLVHAFRTKHNMMVTELAKQAGIDAPNVWNDLNGQIYLGDDQFVESMQ